MTVSDGVSPSPKEGPEPARPPLNPQLKSKQESKSSKFYELLCNSRRYVIKINSKLPATENVDIFG